MQTARNAVASVKEAAANVGASAQSGMEKTKATLQEKAEKVTAQHPAEKDMAEEKKQERIQEAEIHKRQAMEHNAAATKQVRAGQTTGPAGLAAEHPTHTAASPIPGQGHVTEGVVGSHPIGMETGTAPPSAAHNPHAEGTEPAPAAHNPPPHAEGTEPAPAAHNPHAEGTEPPHAEGTKPAPAAQNPHAEGTEPALDGTGGRYT